MIFTKLISMASFIVSCFAFYLIEWLHLALVILLAFFFCIAVIIIIWIQVSIMSLFVMQSPDWFRSRIHEYCNDCINFCQSIISLHTSFCSFIWFLLNFSRKIYQLSIALFIGWTHCAHYLLSHYDFPLPNPN